MLPFSTVSSVGGVISVLSLSLDDGVSSRVGVVSTLSPLVEVASMSDVVVVTSSEMVAEA